MANGRNDFSHWKKMLGTYRWVPYCHGQNVQPNASALSHGTACSSVWPIWHFLTGFWFIWLHVLSTLPNGTHFWQMSPSFKTRNYKTEDIPIYQMNIFNQQQLHRSTEWWHVPWQRAKKNGGRECSRLSWTMGGGVRIVPICLWSPQS